MPESVPDDDTQVRSRSGRITVVAVDKRLARYRSAARPALSLIGWAILVIVVGEAAANVVSGYVDEPGVPFFSPSKNADAFWSMMVLRVAVGLLLGGSLIKMARAVRALASPLCRIPKDELKLTAAPSSLVEYFKDCG